MSYRIYSGDKKSLVFPIMGDGYVHLDYSKHIPTGSDDPYGLWAHKSSFTIEGIITPYDINGFGWTLGADFMTKNSAGSAASTPSISTNVDATNLELPFDNKAFSAVGNIGVASSRSSAYFSHNHVAYLGVAINNSVVDIVLSNVEDLRGNNYIRINNEKMEIVSIEKTFGKYTKVKVARGYDGTTATVHSAKDRVYTDNRLNKKMTLFYNNNCEFYLKNMTRTNMNQPAEYKIGCVIKGKDRNGNVRTVTTESINPVITADKEYYGAAIEQTTQTTRTFGKPVYLNSEDRVKYHRLTDDFVLDCEPILPSNQNITTNGTVTTLTFSALTITLGGSGSPTWTDYLNLAAGRGLMKIIGSANNDGYYTVRASSSTVLTVDNTHGFTGFTSETVADATTVKFYYHTKAISDSFSSLSFMRASYTSYLFDGTSAIDMSEKLWRGRKLYGQQHSSGTYSASVEQKEPTYLGYVEDIHYASNTLDYVFMAACKLIKPVRTKTETTLYVDDAKGISVNDKLRLGTELMTVLSVIGNTISVTRGALSTTAVSTFVDSFNASTDNQYSGDSYNSNTTASVEEEYNFSRTLYKVIPYGMLNGFKMGSESGANSDEFGLHLFGETWKEASYLLRPFHLSMSYDANAKRINLMIDGVPVPTQIFNEGNIRISNMVASSSANVTVTTIDPHGFDLTDEDNPNWVSIEGSGEGDGTGATWDGIYKVTDSESANSFIIQTASSKTLDNATGTMKDVTIRTTNTINDFEFDSTDCYLGSNGNTALETRRASQFMGEIHEFAITKDVKENFNSLDTLIPNFRNTLLYFRFEGENS
tara:strand:- start:12061 stop:14517 length:2457 start_codon:yes stop_codon:yes gene_type:complete